MAMKRLYVLSAAVAFAVSCGSSSTSSPSSPTPTPKPTLVANLSAASEVPPIQGAEAGGTGTVAIVFTTTTDSAGNITSAKANFSISLTGFPSTTLLSNAHIHQGPNGAPVIATLLTASDQLTSSSAGAIVYAKNDVSIDAALAQTILANPANYYFNVHSQANPGGVARGTLSRAQ
jgi:hypothetical protein